MISTANCASQKQTNVHTSRILLQYPRHRVGSIADASLCATQKTRPWHIYLAVAPASPISSALFSVCEIRFRVGSQSGNSAADAGNALFKGLSVGAVGLARAPVARHPVRFFSPPSTRLGSLLVSTAAGSWEFYDTTCNVLKHVPLGSC